MEENNKNNQNEENNLVNKVEFDNNKSEENKNNKLFWKGMLFLGLFPYIYLIYNIIQCFFYGITFFNHTSYGFDAVELVIILDFYLYWFIYIPATILIIVSIVKMSKNKSK